MKAVKIMTILAAAALVLVGLSGTSFAFHSGGVAECMGCHDIHNAQSESALLIAGDATSTCANANCHGSSSAGSYHIMSTDIAGTNNGKVPRQMTPGGDFGWLLKTFTWSPRGGESDTELGERHGHNVVAKDIPGFVVDALNGTAPGGDMDANLLGCNSCHDNHGKLRVLANGTVSTTGAPIIGSGSYTSSVIPSTGQAVGMYRLLRGNGSSAGSGGKTFSTNFFANVASSYNRAETTSPTAIAYGAGITDWCGTCHADMVSATSPNHTHPTNQGFSAAMVTNYNSYLGSGLTGTSGFDTLVPFQSDNVTSLAALQAAAVANVTGTGAQATTSSRVMCLSCHRAHATGFGHMTRWGNDGEFIAVDGVWPGTDSTSSIATAAKYAQGRTTAEMKRAYNDKNMTYASYQRSLCNKCHAKD